MYNMGKYKRAIEDLTASIKTFRSLPPPYGADWYVSLALLRLACRRMTIYLREGSNVAGMWLIWLVAVLRSHYHVGIAFANLGDHRNAVPSFTQAITLKNAYPPYIHERAKSLQMLRDYEAVRSFLHCSSPYYTLE